MGGRQGMAVDRAPAGFAVLKPRAGGSLFMSTVIIRMTLPRISFPLAFCVIWLSTLGDRGSMKKLL